MYHFWRIEIQALIPQVQIPVKHWRPHLDLLPKQQFIGNCAPGRLLSEERLVPYFCLRTLNLQSFPRYLHVLMVLCLVSRLQGIKACTPLDKDTEKTLFVELSPHFSTFMLCIVHVVCTLTDVPPPPPPQHPPLPIQTSDWAELFN